MKDVHIAQINGENKSRQEWTPAKATAKNMFLIQHLVTPDSDTLALSEHYYCVVVTIVKSFFIDSCPEIFSQWRKKDMFIDTGLVSFKVKMIKLSLNKIKFRGYEEVIKYLGNDILEKDGIHKCFWYLNPPVFVRSDTKW